MGFELHKVNLSLEDDEFDQLMIDWLLSWESFRPEWTDFYMVYQEASKALLPYANKNRTQPITGIYSFWDKEETDMFLSKKWPLLPKARYEGEDNIDD